MWAGRRANSSSSTTTISADGAIQPPLDVVQPVLDAGDVPRHHAGADVVHGEHRSVGEDLGWERLEQAAHGGVLAVPLQLRRGELDERRRPLGVPGGHRVANRLRPVVVGLAPVAGPPVELGDEVRRLVQQVGPQHVGEEVVVPVPAAGGRRAGRGRGWPAPAPRAGAAPPSWPVTASHREPVSPLSTEVWSRKVAHVLGLAGQDLAHEVVDDEAVVPREAGDEAGHVVPVLHRQGGELEGGDPSLGAGVQRVDVVGGQVQAHAVVEVRRGLVGGEPQVGGPDLDQLAPGAQPGQGQRRVGPAGDHQVDLRREVLEQEGHRPPGCPALSMTW